MILSGPVGNHESSSVHRRSPKSINQSLNSKFLGSSLVTVIITNPAEISKSGANKIFWFILIPLEGDKTTTACVMV